MKLLIMQFSSNGKFHGGGQCPKLGCRAIGKQNLAARVKKGEMDVNSSGL
jgi:hypothetical protein